MSSKVFLIYWESLNNTNTSFTRWWWSPALISWNTKLNNSTIRKLVLIGVLKVLPNFFICNFFPNFIFLSKLKTPVLRQVSATWCSSTNFSIVSPSSGNLFRIPLALFDTLWQRRRSSAIALSFFSSILFYHYPSLLLISSQLD